jgi:outer membrane biosynthesis protein TonB
MARAQDEFRSLRLGRREGSRLVVAALVSILVHLAVYGGYHAGERLGVWQRVRLPQWLQLHLGEKRFDLQAQLAHETGPNIFVDVSHADADAPAPTRYYSDKNSRAANPELANANVPKIRGSQKEVPKTEDVPRPAPKIAAALPSPKETPKQESKPDTSPPKLETTPSIAQLQPSMPPPSLTPLTTAQTPAPTPQTPGETDARKPARTVTSTAPNPTPAEMPAPAQPARPRTLKQALAQRDQIPGRQMEQDGGVARHAMWSSLDVKSTPFGDYDRAIIEAVSQRWYDLLDSHRYAQDRDGKVILRFKLKPDGTVIEMQTLDNTVGEVLGYLCQESIEEAAPFAKWPPDMVRMIGANYRDITFTFYYY